MDWGPRGNSRLWRGTQALWEAAVGDPLPADHQTGQRRFPYSSDPGSIHPACWYKPDPGTTVQKTAMKRPKDMINTFNFSTFPSLYLSFRQLYTDQNGNLLKTGEIVKFEKLADTLETIATHGADAFYTGRIAEDLIGDIQEAGIVRRVSSCSLFFQPFPISAWHSDLITNGQINWACKALQRSLTDSSVSRLDPLKVLIMWSWDAFCSALLRRTICFNVFAQEEHSRRRTWHRIEPQWLMRGPSLWERTRCTSPHPLQEASSSASSWTSWKVPAAHTLTHTLRSLVGCVEQRDSKWILSCIWVVNETEWWVFHERNHLNTAHLWELNTLGETKQLLLFTGYNLTPASLTGEQKTMTYHRLVEAFKFANGLKKHIRDPRFSSEEVSYF